MASWKLRKGLKYVGMRLLVVVHQTHCAMGSLASSSTIQLRSVGSLPWPMHQDQNFSAR
jgi:hypothetical protein